MLSDGGRGQGARCQLAGHRRSFRSQAMDGAHGRLSDYRYCAHDHTPGQVQDRDRTCRTRLGPQWGRGQTAPVGQPRSSTDSQRHSSGGRWPGSLTAGSSLTTTSSVMSCRAAFAACPPSRGCRDGPHPPAELEPEPSCASVVVLAGRATHVPQAAVTSGIQRTTTVTR
jgi:hypothetical protein